MAGVLPYLLSMPALLTCIGILVPFGTAVYYSLQRYNLAFPTTRNFIWFANYISLLSDACVLAHRSSFRWFTPCSRSGLELLLGLGIALLLWRRTIVTNLLSVALILPLMVAPAIAALMWKLMTNANFGILSYFVSLLGFHDFKWASAPQSAMFTVVLVDMWVYTPFITILLLAGLRGLPRQPFEAAELDGVPASFVFFRIMLPMLLPYILTAGLFRMLDFDPAVRHHLRDDAGRTGRHAHGLPGPGLHAGVHLHQYRPGLGDPHGPLGHHLRAEQRLREELAAPARAGPRTGLSGDASMNGKSVLRAVALTADRSVLPVPAVLGRC